jgi:hypothetical protein
MLLLSCSILLESLTSFQVSTDWQVFTEENRQVDRTPLFNLKPDLCLPLTNGDFLPDRPITITATLRPDFLHYLTNYPTSETATTYLQDLQQTQPDHPLLDPTNWYALEVKQQQDPGETGYRTLWYYLTPSTFTTETPSSEVITQGFTEFFKASLNFDEFPFEDLAIAPQIDRLTESLTQSLETLWSDSEGELSEALTEITSAFDEIAEAVEEIPETDANPGIYPALIEFFTQDDWPFSKVQGEMALQIPCQGENGTWLCYARAQEEQQQFIFYSICPIAIPKPKRSKLAEFITRANYGMTIGNFELDYTDGEIRYKTSIDVEGEKLTSALIKRLVYTNVAMMDEYLPGIRAMIEEGLGAEAAIQATEEKV